MNKSFLLTLLLFCFFLSAPSAASGTHDYSFKVSRGDAFYKFFFKTGLSGKLLKKLMASDERAQKLNNIYPGDSFRITLNDNHELDQIIYSPANDNPLFITYDGQSFDYGKTSVQPIGELSHTTITIKKSLNYDAKKAGVGAEVIKMMVDNFSWEIDFSRDLRKGDKFILSWNEEKAPVAMVFVGSRKTIALFSYKNTLGQNKYFNSKGASINDTFTFAPVKHSRISSGFTKRRFHPTLKIYRSHRGTDFAAPTGTPIYAPAKGVVKYKATLSGYGNVIYLQHGTDYVTVYAHLSKFAKGLKSGKKVKKSELIGYVGSTGQSTGPHLHYEIRINGVHQDAEKIKLPKQSFVPSSAMPKFQKRARKILQDLDIG
jgi:murein DD-endopeptidase MepM/ murein hydrolase activator NlpD